MRGSNASDAPTVQLLVRVGTVVAGKFRVERILAEGGMGVVVAATHLQLDRPVALKFLRADVTNNVEALARFTREAKAAAQLKSEYVAHVLDVGITDDGTPYMVMEYLEGLSLYRVLQTHGPLGIASATEYAIQACEGLAEAHSRGIVHRDIKPDNLFLIERAPGWRSIKILDFGISKLAFADPNNIATGVIMGSPCYMSPEQLRSTATVDHRTDFWSLGCTLYELLTGKAAFDASLTLPELVATILHKTALPIQTLRPAIPDGLAAVVDRCLAKDRESRFGSAAELAKALQPFATDRARGAVERAASMVPVFPIARREGETTDARAQAQKLETQSEMHRVDQLMGIVPPHGVTTNSGLGTVSVTPTPLSVTNPPPSDAAELPPFRRKTKQLVLTTWGVGAVLVIGLVAALRRKPALPESAAMVAPQPPPVVQNIPETVDLVVRVSPGAAQITVDGALVSGNPFHARYPKDEATHQIRATAPGFDPKWEEVPLSHDVVVDMSLDRHAASARVVPTLPLGRTSTPATPVVRTASAPARPVKKVAIDNTPAVAQPAPPPPPVKESVVPSSPDVSPTGGRPPLRPIETKNPYGTP